MTNRYHDLTVYVDRILRHLAVKDATYEQRDVLEKILIDLETEVARRMLTEMKKRRLN